MRGFVRRRAREGKTISWRRALHSAGRAWPSAGSNIEEMFSTGHDAANRAVLAEHGPDGAKVVGVALREERKSSTRSQRREDASMNRFEIEAMEGFDFKACAGR